MDITFNTISYVLQEEDVEGLIATGAPADEYDAEAKSIALTLAALPAEKRTRETVVAAITLVWGKYFELSTEEVAMRMPALGRVADKLLA